MKLPKFLKNFQSEAEKFLSEDLFGDIEFSGATYQIQVLSPSRKKDCWTFFQLDNQGGIKDSFCSCEEGGEILPCVHQAAAFLRIYNGQNAPLHQRFEHSLWNVLCRIYADQVGFDLNILKHKGKGVYECSDSEAQMAFSIKGTTAKDIKHLDDIIFHRHRETEETSLKFSNLSQDEILLWKQGKPSFELQYELSFWSDFAKWMMCLQDAGKPYSIHFAYSAKNVPEKITIRFPGIQASFFLSEENLCKIIPALVSVNSPLAVHHKAFENIEKITFDEKRGSFLITHLATNHQEKKKGDKLKNGIHLDGWIFIPDQGFYSSDDRQLFSKDEIPSEQVENALNEHIEAFKVLLKGCTIHDGIVYPSYALSFDANWNLTIEPYVFEKGDLALPNSHCFGTWIYLDKKGFYRIEQLRFSDIPHIVAEKDITDFISQERSWLNAQDGFHIYQTAFEASVTYTLDADRRLTFFRHAAHPEIGDETKDFGRWIYVAGQGFFSKASLLSAFSLRFGKPISAEQIPLFIRENHEELKLVENFFSENCPASKAKLNVFIQDDGNVAVVPKFEIKPEYEKKNILFFDDYVYAEGEGFHELPPDMRLPEPYRHEHIIGQDSLSSFFKHDLTALRHWIEWIDPRLIEPEQMMLHGEQISHADAHKRGWYSLKLSYETEKGSVPIWTLWKAYQAKKRFVYSDAGLIDLESKRLRWIKLLNKERVDLRSHTVFLPTIELMRLNALDEIQTATGDKKDHSRDILRTLTEFRIEESPNLDGLKSILRPYQQQGVNWLWFLFRQHLSGLLCDDMGLGKTHQAMALLAAIVNYYRAMNDQTKRHFLVVCPTSVIYHWQEKFQEYLPGFRIWTFYGVKRSLETFYENCDLLLTSYGIWRNEAEELSKFSFEVAIFDEIQVAKNHASRIHGALSAANAQMRIGLTGTPIENHLRELKALFDIVLPGYMPSDADFREFFAIPIEKEGNTERKRLLSRMIKPFVLRRKKGDVLLDLPEKTEEISHCDLKVDQRRLYNEILQSGMQKILPDLEDESLAIPYIHVFALLTHLKQICDHPAVFLKKPQRYKEYHSGKWELFLELLSEARESSQKVVVFSHYLGMLDIIEEYLNEHSIGYAAIRGATVDRREQLQRFNQDPSCEVFVASLQAAGLGIDLTAASVVIHYDRWWNAARENQATDRVHRIGQTRGVQVFKLVTKDTLEEHIDALITKKGKLMEEVVGVDDIQVIKQLDRHELLELLRIVPDRQTGWSG